MTLEVIAVLNIAIMAFWDVTSCILVDTFVRSFGDIQPNYKSTRPRRDQLLIICYSYTIWSYACVVLFVS